MRERSNKLREFIKSSTDDRVIIFSNCSSRSQSTLRRVNQIILEISVEVKELEELTHFLIRTSTGQFEENFYNTGDGGDRCGCFNTLSLSKFSVIVLVSVFLRLGVIFQFSQQSFCSVPPTFFEMTFAFISFLIVAAQSLTSWVMIW